MTGFSFFDRMCAALRRRLDERQTVRELNALTDRELRDIGISRNDIAEIARSLHQRPDARPSSGSETGGVEPAKLAA